MTADQGNGGQAIPPVRTGTIPCPPRQRAIWWTVAVVCAASRFLAMARTLWDWDEALFCLGMRSYDVTAHHPHPPGFPVYIALAKVARLFLHNDFRALQSVNLVAGMLLFPALFLLGREIGLRFETALVAATLCVFFPNVWFFGGGAFSDIPSLTLAVFGAALLFRGARERNAYWLGTLVLALSIGIRPQNLLIGLFPGICATLKRKWPEVLLALGIGVIVAGGAFAAAAYATGDWARYLDAVHGHGDYIARIDSFRSPARPPLWRLFDRFFIKQYDAPALSIITSILVLVSAVGAIRDRDRAIGRIALTFGPFAISAWLMLDRFSVSRFSIGYIPMFAVLAADGIARVTRRRGELLLGGALVVAFIIWTFPALTIVRDEASPSVQAVEAVQRTVDSRRAQLFVGHAMTPFIEYLLPHVPYTTVQEERALPLTAGARPAFLLTELDHTHPKGQVFSREHGRLWYIARRHYFDVGLVPVQRRAQFLSGWYSPEGWGTQEWRWMGAHSVTQLPPSSGENKLRLIWDLPIELAPARPTVTVTLNGKVLDRVRGETHTERDYDVKAAPNGLPNMLELMIDRTFSPGRDDRRDLGPQLRYLSWGEAE